MIQGYGPVTQALLGTLLTWGFTALGSLMVIFLRGNQVNKSIFFFFLKSVQGDDDSGIELFVCFYCFSVYKFCDTFSMNWFWFGTVKLCVHKIEDTFFYYRYTFNIELSTDRKSRKYKQNYFCIFMGMVFFWFCLFIFFFWIDSLKFYNYVFNSQEIERFSFYLFIYLFELITEKIIGYCTWFCGWCYDCCIILVVIGSSNWTFENIRIVWTERRICICTRSWWLLVGFDFCICHRQSDFIFRNQ